MPRSVYMTIQVSEKTYDLIADLEAAWCRFSAAADDLDRRPDLSEAGDAYAALCQRRKELYRHISALEFNAHIDRPIKVRFD